MGLEERKTGKKITSTTFDIQLLLKDLCLYEAQEDILTHLFYGV